MATKKKDKNLSVQPVLKGKIILDPEYLEQTISEYQDNPCIEALPAIFDDEYIVEKLAYYPTASEKDRSSSENIRYHIIKRIKSYYQPLNNHLKIEHLLSTAIRRSYIARNLNSKEYLMRIRLIVDALEEQKNDIHQEASEVCKNISDKFKLIPETSRSSEECFSIIGISGMGKSEAIEKLILMYPQVIIHTEYKGKPLTRTQIPWIKLECPFDGSLKALCIQFFKALDEVLLTTRYSERYGSNRNSTATMMIYMSHLASLYSVGVLIIDEMQNLINPKNRADDILNFLVTLINTIGISVVQIGTPNFTRALSRGLRQLRRAQESGSIFWDRMKENEEWDFFIENLWGCQFVRNYVPLSNELKDAMYYETQGITALTVTLFILVQAEAIFSDKERITIELIHEVAKNDLRLTKKLVDAIRSNNIDEMKDYEDISIDVDEMLEKKIENSKYHERLKELSIQIKESISNKNRNFKDSMISEIISMDLFNYIDYEKLEKIVDSVIKSKSVGENPSIVKQNVIMAAMKEEEKLSLIASKNDKQQKEKKSVILKDDLRYISEEAAKEKKHIYEALKDNNYIMNPLEEFYNLNSIRGN